MSVNRAIFKTVGDYARLLMRTVLDEKGNVDFSRARPFVYNQGEYWSMGKKVGSFGFSKKK